MKNTQMIHIGMVNSYHVLMGNATIEQIVGTGFGIFSHALNEQDAKESIELMIIYFKHLEMYERCAKLKKYIEDTFDENGLYKQESCSCEYPEIDVYVLPIKCSLCDLRINR